MAKVLMVGAGAVGAPIAAWLAGGGHRVSVLARGSTADVLEKQGITWTSSEEPDVRTSARVDVVRELRAGDRPDLVLVSVKTAALDEICAALAKTYGRELLVVGLQNGIEVLRILPAHFRRPQLAIVHFNGWQESPGEYGVQSRGPLVLAPLGTATPADVEIAHGLLARATTVVRAERARDAALCKMVLNLTGSLQALTAFHETPADDAFALQSLISSLLAEGVDVVRGAGAQEVKVPGTPPWLVLRASSLLPKRLTRPIFERNLGRMRIASLAQDLARGVPLAATELDPIHGELVRLADEHAVPAKVMRAVLVELRERFGERPYRPMQVSELARRVGIA